jgi:cold shock CspA family protein
MGRSQETFGKKDNEKKRAKKRTEKEERKAERQANAKSGQALEEMLAYVDEDGNISATPPDPKKKRIIKDEDIQIGVARRTNDDDADPVRTGIVSFFNESKGYGFIKDQHTQESIFVHANGLASGPIGENDKVTFEVEMGPKGPNAVRVKKASATPPAFTPPAPTPV